MLASIYRERVRHSINRLSKQELLSFFVACSLFLSSIEYLLPRPAPFFRFGLSNIVLLLILRNMYFKHILLILLLRVVATGMLHGTIASYVFVFSISGSFSALFVQWIVAKLLRDRVGLLGLSFIGSATSNIVQILFSIVFIFGASSVIMIPYLLLLGFISGAVVGLLADYYYCHSHLLSLLLGRYELLCSQGTSQSSS